MKIQCDECQGHGCGDFAVWRGGDVVDVRETCEKCDGVGELLLCSECGEQVPPRKADEYDQLRELCGVCSDEAEEAERKAAEAARPSDSAALAGATAALIGQCLGASRPL